MHLFNTLALLALATAATAVPVADAEPLPAELSKRQWGWGGYGLGWYGGWRPYGHRHGWYKRNLGVEHEPDLAKREVAPAVLHGDQKDDDRKNDDLKNEHDLDKRQHYGGGYGYGRGYGGGYGSGRGYGYGGYRGCKRSLDDSHSDLDLSKRDSVDLFRRDPGGGKQDDGRNDGKKDVGRGDEIKDDGLKYNDGKDFDGAAGAAAEPSEAYMGWGYRPYWPYRWGGYW
ncbi:hypothetical protein Rhopal_001065-T1 [Rhodotorula paludigena]|uniref:Uncharacterized protein n=1 Tax=Rhodotorula paludigena TaxID=86838 RepID=A0AAV5GDZ4_9BASI|nr:hypothetical protein Rhopal_001065-T1 [Rhodotorula paludigena]